VLGKAVAATKALVICATCITLFGCTAKYTPLSLRVHAGVTQIQWRACASNHQIGDLELYRGPLPSDADRATPLWQVASFNGGTTTQATLGVTPPGFHVEVALSAPLVPEQEYTLLANLRHPIVGRVTFRPSQLTEGVVIFARDQVVKVDAYDRLSNEDFGC
jgi:hypothetical protein